MDEVIEQDGDLKRFWTFLSGMLGDEGVMCWVVNCVEVANCRRENRKCPLVELNNIVCVCVVICKGTKFL